MPGTHPEMTIPASAPGESSALSAKTDPIESLNNTVNPIIMTNARRESITMKGGIQPISRNESSSSFTSDDKLGLSKPLRQPNLNNTKEDADSLALKEFVNDDRHFSLVRNFRLADVITIMNGVCGSLSIFSSCQFILSLELQYLHRACLFPILSLGFDFLDGKVARFRQESSVLGQELDSLADLISFGVAPSLVGYCIGLRHPIDIGILTFFICAGLTRLARFNSTAAFKPENGQTPKPSGFEGLPIPTSLGLIAGMYQCIRLDQISLPRDPQVLQHLLKLESLGIDKLQLERLRLINEKGNQLYGGIVEFLDSRYGLKVHWLSIIFGTWALFMLSKTLKVPKL
ncbi:uncharacterized protein MELLADRAFT_72122 [Melampsora larici-populina 98AG31]|uniref:CDP-diacylglycerol--serine O-phosphatidyltransferase n=1 Tax=Melampsora larici-populina (strain 98AG31 / pathotype 3-4-7) TaxID=747676 RepID=F4RQ12_MELLP|nr:uncharacterized protein MELLADRAFT_72122 [Melampsora larici-populina 98AG31]EGG05633.1 hypothetical protein MELLADRAFT_72122 [Melampsora larici-populina 98AG31]